MTADGRPAPLLGLALGGALSGHLLAYAVAFVDAVERRAHLASTGHAAFAPMAMLAAVAVGVALVGLGVRVWRSAPPTVGWATWTRLAGIQLAVFALIETAERGFDPSVAVGDPAVRLGLAIQLLVAGALALALRLFVRTVGLVAARLRSRRSPARARVRPAIVERGPFARAPRTSASRRGPPLRLPS